MSEKKRERRKILLSDRRAASGRQDINIEKGTERQEVGFENPSNPDALNPSDEPKAVEKVVPSNEPKSHAVEKKLEDREQLKQRARKKLSDKFPSKPLDYVLPTSVEAHDKAKSLYARRERNYRKRADSTSSSSSASGSESEEGDASSSSSGSSSPRLTIRQSASDGSSSDSDSSSSGSSF